MLAADSSATEEEVAVETKTEEGDPRASRKGNECSTLIKEQPSTTRGPSHSSTASSDEEAAVEAESEEAAVQSSLANCQWRPSLSPPILMLGKLERSLWSG